MGIIVAAPFQRLTCMGDFSSSFPIPPSSQIPLVSVASE